MFWFLLIAMVVVVAAVTLVVVGGDSGGLRDAEPDRLYDPLPPERPLARADVDAVRFPVTVRGYCMNDVDDVLDRLGAELAERDARIAELEAALAGAHAAAIGGPELIADAAPEPPQDSGADAADAPDTADGTDDGDGRQDEAARPASGAHKGEDRA